MNSTFTKILGIDLSFRHTGWALVGRQKSNNVTMLNLIDKDEINTTRFEDDGIAFLYIINTIDELVSKHLPSHIVLELPDKSQSARSAYLNGVMQSIVWVLMFHKMINIKVVNMKILKQWSNSKRGDKKEKVKAKVKEYFPVDTNNDNILDAIGLCLWKCDELSKNKQ